jgi:AGCS family alanine or glycine:cation symporter
MENTVHEMFALMVDFLRSFLFWDPFAAFGLFLGVEVPFSGSSHCIATLGSWAPYVLLLCMLLFVYSTLIGWSYYGVKGFDYLFGGLSERLTGSRKTAEKFYQVVFLMVIVLGTTTPLALIIDFSDMLVLAMSLPNLIGLYLMAPEIKRDLLRYKP